MNVRKQRSLMVNCLKFKLEEDFEILWTGILNVRQNVANCTVCGEDPQYWLFKEFECLCMQ